MPTRNARNGQAFTADGPLTITHARFARDPAPLDPECACEACRRFSRAYLRHLFVARELLAYRLLSLHNVTFYLGLMAGVRRAIAEGCVRGIPRSVSRSIWGRIRGRFDRQRPAFGGLSFMVDFAYAMAQAPNGGGSSGVMMQLLFFAAIFAIFYFLLIRPQQKQKRERETMLAPVKKGDRVVTTSGLHGTVVGLTEQHVTLKVADQVKLDFDRTALGRIVHAVGRQGVRGLMRRHLWLRIGIVVAVVARSPPCSSTRRRRPSTSGSTCRAASTSCSAWTSTRRSRRSRSGRATRSAPSWRRRASA